MPKIFLSHASKDKDLADALVDLIQTGTDLSSSEVFCTSLEGLGVPSGKDFITYIKAKIQSPEVVILLLTPNYFASQFCLAELGASWAMSHNALPVLVPPLTYDDIKGVLLTTQIDRIDQTNDMDRFLDSLASALSLSPRWPRLRAKKDQFLGRLPGVLSRLDKPSAVTVAQFEKLKKDNADFAREIAEYEKENSALRVLVADLEKCKDAVDVAATKAKHLEELPALMEKIRAVHAAFDDLPAIVAYLMFRHLEGYPVRFGSDQREADQDAGRAIHDDFVVDDDGLRPNEHDPKVKTASRALESLKRFIEREASPELEEAFEKQYGYRLTIQNLRFWNDLLCSGIRRYQ